MTRINLYTHAFSNTIKILTIIILAIVEIKVISVLIQFVSQSQGLQFVYPSQIKRKQQNWDSRVQSIQFTLWFPKLVKSNRGGNWNWKKPNHLNSGCLPPSCQLTITRLQLNKKNSDAANWQRPFILTVKYDHLQRRFILLPFIGYFTLYRIGLSTTL